MNFHIKFTYYIYFVPSLSIIFCATLFSGAQYRYDALEDWEVLVHKFLTQLPHVTSLLGMLYHLYGLPISCLIQTKLAKIAIF